MTGICVFMCVYVLKKYSENSVLQETKQPTVMSYNTVLHFWREVKWPEVSHSWNLSNFHRKLHFLSASGMTYIYLHSDSLWCLEAMSIEERSCVECSPSSGWQRVLSVLFQLSVVRAPLRFLQLCAEGCRGFLSPGWCWDGGGIKESLSPLFISV